jgi:flagellar motor protein MotB
MIKSIMKKLKITKEQYDRLVLTEQKVRTNVYVDGILTEDINNKAELLDEGLKDILLGVSMLIGLNLSGQNKDIGDKALNNANILKQIEATLEDKSKTQELIDAMKAKGIKDPSAMLATNAEKIIDRYNEISDDKDINIKLGVVAVNNLKSLESKLKQGYAVKSAEMSTDTIKGVQETKIVVVKDTLSIDLDNMQNMFVTGGYQLSEDGKKAIKDAIESVTSQGGKIISVEIESSTDAEKMASLSTKEDPTGNIELANLRSQSVNDIVGGLVSGAEVTTREIPNNGSEVVSPEMFKKAANNKEELLKLRNKTSEFRYVKLNIVAEFTTETIEPEPKPDVIIKKYRFEVVKMYETSSTIKKIGGGKPHFKHKKFKCKKLKDKSIVSRCATF